MLSVCKGSGLKKFGLMRRDCTCHESACKAYKRACKFAVNGRTTDRFHLIDKLASQKKPRQLWNIIRKSRDLNKNLSNAISLEKLESYFSDKFSNKTSNSPVIDQAMHETSRHFTNCDKVLYSEYVFTEYQIKNTLKSSNLDQLVVWTGFPPNI